MPPTPPAEPGELAALRKRLRESDSIAHAALGRLTFLERSVAIENGLTRAALLAMVLANFLAYTWATR